MSDHLPPGVIRFADWTVLGRWWPTMRRYRTSDATVIHHSVTNTSGDSGIEQVREVERVIYGRRFRSRFSMIAYSWLIDTYGVAYEGRGTTWRNGANTDKKDTGFGNRNTMSICFIGNYQPDVDGVPTLYPTTAQLETAGELIAWLDMAHELVRDYRVLPHSYVHTTSCPGDHLRQQMAQLEHYAKYHLEETNMFVTKNVETDTSGRLWFGDSYFESSNIGYWEDRVGPSNVYVSPHFTTVYQGLKHSTETFEPIIVEPSPIDYDALAKAVADELARRMEE